MLSRELIVRMRRLRLRARRAVEDPLGGEYRSVFKGLGVAFEEVREYQAGDDIRTIDWNVTARMGHPFVKRYVEERELTVLLIVDASASQRFGTSRQTKGEVAAEMAALVAFCAAGSNDKVGLIVASDRVEKFVPPRKGMRHALRLIRDILFFQPSYPGTSLAEALDFLNRVQRRRAIVFLFSDFLDQGYEKSLRRGGKRHDLIAVPIADPCEKHLPGAGLIEWEDAETGQRQVIDAGSAEVRAAWQASAQERRAALAHCCRSAGIDIIEATTDGNHLDELTRFFHLRQKRLGRG